MKIKITRRINNLLTTAAVIASAVCFFNSCDDDTLFFSYGAVNNEHWEKSHGVFFEVVPNSYEGPCSSYVLVRTTDKYPFKNLSLFVEYKMRDRKEVRRVDFDLSTSEGKGIRHNDYIMPAGNFNVSEGDTVSIRISHDMRNNILTGVTDVGIKVKKLK